MAQRMFQLNCQHKSFLYQRGCAAAWQSCSLKLHVHICVRVSVEYIGVYARVGCMCTYVHEFPWSILAYVHMFTEAVRAHMRI